MNRMRILGFGVILALGACVQIAGIEDPILEEGNSAAGGPSGVSIGSSGQGGTTSSSGQGGQGGTSGQGGSAGQTSSSSSSSSSGGPVDPEDCLDGLDNDNDGAIDCADTDCTMNFTCTDEPPAGWTGVALEEGMGVPPVAIPCDDGAMPELLYTGPAGPPQCSNCLCGVITGNTCNAPGLACYVGSNNCGSGQEDWTGNFGNGNCAKPNIGVGTFSLSCRLSSAASGATPGSCPQSISDFPNKETWAGWAQACAIKTSAGGCAAGTVCAAKPMAMQSLCIRQDGQQTCPAGWSTVEAYAGGMDDRSCGACSCAANPTCTGGTYQVFDSNNCDPNELNPIAVNNNICRNVSGQLDFGAWSVQKSPPAAGGACTAQGGAPTGAVTPSGMVTFCCK